jgi:protein-L-isoaspartate(D-aspartate) O-methyltransferase
MNATSLNIAALLEKRRLPDLPEPRRRMVEHLARNPAFARPVLESMGTLPRHAFAPPQFWRLAYGEYELWAPGGYLARPSLVARIGTEIIERKSARVLVYAAWTGYEACIWSLHCEETDTVEHDPWLLWAAADANRELGIRNIHQKASDGQLGWVERSPYDAVVFLAAIPGIPPSLWEQVKDHGVIIAPIGVYGQQQVVCVEKNSQGRTHHLGSGLFPALVGVWGYFFGPLHMAGGNFDGGLEGVGIEGARLDESSEPSATTEEHERQSSAERGAGEEIGPKTRPSSTEGRPRGRAPREP